jgi:hypothetical protein
MSHLEVHNHSRVMTPEEVAAELRRLADELESKERISYMTGAIAVSACIEREFHIDDSGDGASCEFNYRLKWPVHDDAPQRASPSADPHTCPRCGGAPTRGHRQ